MSPEQRAHRRPVLLDVIEVLNDSGDDGSKSDEWLAGFQHAIDCVRWMARDLELGPNGECPHCGAVACRCDLDVGVNAGGT